MIVRCPECQTGFNLAPEKVPAKGAKLRCSQCDHVFRVRITDGRSEIFYKNKAENIPVADANNETQIGGLHRPNKVEPKRETEQLPTAPSGGETSFGYPSRTGTQPRQRGMVPLIAPKVKALPVRAPILTPPAIDRRLPVEKPPKPISASASKRKLTPVPSDDLDLFGDDSGFNFSNNDRSVEDPFFGAFDDADDDSLFSSPKAQEDFDLSEPSFDSSSEPKSDFSQNDLSWGEEPEVEEKIEVETSSDDYFTRGGSSRNYDSLAPPKPSPPATPSIPKVEIKTKPAPTRSNASAPKAEPKLELAIERKPAKPTRPPRAESAGRSKSPNRSSSRSKEKKEVLSEPRPAGPIALKPHKIGGNSFRRLFDTLFIGIFLLGSFIAVVAFKNGGFFDFSAPLHMLEVAFDGKPYEMNPNVKIKEVGSNTSATPFVKNLIAAPYRLKSKDHVLLVNGFVNNPGANEKTKQALLVEITSSAGKKEKEVHIGESLSITELKERLDADSFSTLAQTDRFEKASSTPFFVVFRSPVRFRDLAIKTKIISK